MEYRTLVCLRPRRCSVFSFRFIRLTYCTTTNTSLSPIGFSNVHIVRRLLFILRCSELGSKTTRATIWFSLIPLLRQNRRAIKSRSIFLHAARSKRTHNSGRICMQRRGDIKYPFQFESNQRILRRDGRVGRAARRDVTRKRRYMSRRDIIHMPATRLARHSGRRGNITFFPDPSSLPAVCARSSNTPCLSVPFFALRRSHARPEMTPLGTRRNRANTFSSPVFPSNDGTKAYNHGFRYVLVADIR